MGETNLKTGKGQKCSSTCMFMQLMFFYFFIYELNMFYHHNYVTLYTMTSQVHIVVHV